MAARRDAKNAKNRPNNRKAAGKSAVTNADDAQSTDSRLTILHSTADTAVLTFKDAFEALVKVTPRDRNGFLTYFLDHNQLPQDFHTRPQLRQQQFIDLARVSITNAEGYPTYNFHQPIWNQLPHEPDSYFQAFRAYLLSPERSLSDAKEHLPLGFSPMTLEEAYTYYYWSERARAYDTLRPVAAARLRDQRLLLMEDSHFRISQKLLKQLGEEVKERSEEQGGRPWQGLQSADLLKGIVAVVEMQRTSVGLPAKGPKLREDGHVPAPHGGIDRNVREGVANYLGTENDQASPAQELRRNIEAAIAADPNLAAKMQAHAIELMMAARRNKDAAKTAIVPTSEGNPHDKSND